MYRVDNENWRITVHFECHYKHLMKIRIPTHVTWRKLSLIAKFQYLLRGEHGNAI